MAELTISSKARDEVALTVLQRFRRASQYRDSYILHQGHTVNYLIDRAKAQYDREYIPEDQAAMTRAFGFCPTRYMGIVQQKVNATYNWKLDLVITSLDSMFTVSPTPEPDIDDASRERIREGVRMELMAKMADAGIVDAELLLNARGELGDRMIGFLQEQAQALKKVEQARIVSTAAAAAQRAQTAMRDKLVEGGFRQAYIDFSFDQILYGRGVIRFPHWQRQSVLMHTRGGGVKRVWDTRPSFSHVNVRDFFIIDDGKDLQTNTGNIERTTITKTALIAAAKQDGYFEDQIIEIVEEFAYKSRNWLYPDDNDEDGIWWELDETIPLLIHEGYFSGSELADMGVTGVDTMAYVNARVEVCGGRTIRCQMIEAPDGDGRTYFQAPFVRKGTGLYDAIGMGAMLWDTEQRVNRLMHIFEHNIDWAARPPVMRNRSAFDNPVDAELIQPGNQYDVEERFGVTGSMPDAIRTMNPVSAQYHLIMTQVGALLRQADEDVGVPAFAYSSQDFGRSSLGEYTQRMSNALRTIKGLALQEDIHFIEPAFTNLFDYEMENDAELRVGQDINVLVRGLTGLLREDVAAQRQQAALPMVLQAGQAGLIPQQAVDYAVRQMLEDAGFPVDALGMSDPVIDNALAVAANMPVPGASAAGQQVPTLDGRSGPIPQENVAQASGMSNLSQIAPIE